MKATYDIGVSSAELYSGATEGSHDGAPFVGRQAPVLGSDRPDDVTGSYFRCHPLQATLSLAHCRANRLKLSYHQALEMQVDPLPPDIQPLACWSCGLAHVVEAGRVPFYTRMDVLRRRVPAADPNSESPPARWVARPKGP